MPENSPLQKITLSPSGKQFSSLPNSSILESGLAAGMALPYRCSNGSCGDCRARIVCGEVQRIRFHDYVLSESEKLSGVCLLCSNSAQSPLTIEVTEANHADDIPVQKLSAKLCHIEQLNGILIARFKIVRGKVLRFLPGQYTTLLLEGLSPVVLPIANCPCESSYLEFHIPTSQEELCQRIHTLRSSGRVTVEGPQGRFTPAVSNTATAPATTLFIASAEYFAAIKPLIEHVISQEQETPTTLLWIAGDHINHYKGNLCRSWADAFDWFSYYPVNTVSEARETLQAIEPPYTVYLSAANQTQQLEQLLLNRAVAAQHITVDNTLGDTNGN